MFEISFSTRAKREFDEMEERHKGRVAEVLRTLSFDPVPVKIFDVKKLAGLANAFRIRIGKIRIVYAIDWERRHVVIRNGIRLREV